MTTLIPHAELRAFARIATRLLGEHGLREGGVRPVGASAGAGLEFLDHREYQAGDELRRVDWRQSARQQRTIVRRQQREAATDWYLCVDSSSSMVDRDGRKWRLASQCAAAIAYALLEMGHRVGLLQFAEQITALCPPGRGVKQYLRLTALLQRSAPRARGAGSQLGACVPRIAGGATAFVISDFLASDQMQRDLAALRAICAGVHALQLGGGGDFALDDDGHVTLVDVESGERIDAVASAALAQRAAQNIDQMRVELRRYCHARSLRHSAWDSDRHWRDVLVGHLGGLRRH